ncbi:metal-dependent hydrolase [Paraburkholderia phymatum]|uniref:metal-dependent hydrolase n=1 Tax=Paraburkholderia phymatum TaxID=148447 RepID=UPI00317CC1F0
MEVRFPTFDFSRFRAHWARNREFAQAYNAFSIVPAHIEPYLIKVMMWARKELDPAHAQLHAEMGVFIRQETQHCKQHVAFNKFMHDGGYAGMLPIEEEYKADYQRFLTAKSLRFNLAYCEGFEALGCASAEVWFSGAIDMLLEGADPYAVQLWKWHLAEEFEHRTVCFDAFKTLCAKGPWKSVVYGYFYRIYGFIRAARHINGYTERCTAYLLATDRAELDETEIQQSKLRERAMRKAVNKATLPILIKVFSPFYNPRRKRMPREMSELLAHYAQPAESASR